MDQPILLRTESGSIVVEPQHKYQYEVSKSAMELFINPCSPQTPSLEIISDAVCTMSVEAGATRVLIRAD